MFQNLKTAKSHTLKMHLDRLQLVAESVAELSMGEVLALRPSSAAELARVASSILKTLGELQAQYAALRGPDPVDN